MFYVQFTRNYPNISRFLIQTDCLLCCSLALKHYLLFEIFDYKNKTKTPNIVGRVTKTMEEAVEALTAMGFPKVQAVAACQVSCYMQYMGPYLTR